MIILFYLVFAFCACTASGFSLLPQTSKFAKTKTHLKYLHGGDEPHEAIAVFDVDGLINIRRKDHRNASGLFRFRGMKKRIKRRLRLDKRSHSHLCITRLYSGVDGQSHLERLDLLLTDFVDEEGAFGQATQWMSCDRMTIRIAPPGYEHTWHNAPRRQYVIQLKGFLEVEVDSGARAVIGPGDILLAEDMSGKGHITRQKGDEPCMYAVVVPDEDEDDEMVLTSSSLPL